MDAPNGHVPRVIAHPSLLLEARVVLLIDDDQTECADGREQSAARPDRHVGRASAQPPPHRMALARGEPRVQHGNVVAEASAETAHELRRECDFWNEYDRATPARSRGGDRPQV